ncbi:TPA: MOSC domain-containing protein [Candidatus Poribacteria bacterium]|jgi:MOSC domain-containing protein YiiM|nr:MOSC domain-containing protein [Candidatus Poribacteria bacterium]HIB86533.1 MOSC domain-containing protein [Candidatus Poribacteria bacterium]HIC03070.1 MOSC domain-containing protein [Candidatus Poribacteria bacterium]HIC19233.1 MOSC domain-containing protein [Candidatus Poribacteria bacterium]HIM10136.1 MOSC domain-containing protein [Candidatus Poribacteria bacterium]
MMRNGKLKGIAIRKESRAPMELLNAADVSIDLGIDGDFRGKHVTRQVTLLAEEDWGDACSDLGADLPWTTRRANLLTDGISFENTIGSHLQIGEIVLQVTGETQPCSRMDEAYSGLQDALTPAWRGGVLCLVVTGGRIQMGDSIRFK